MIAEQGCHSISMTATQGVVVGGVDCHAEFPHVAALDEHGRTVADWGFPAALATATHSRGCEAADRCGRSEWSLQVPTVPGWHANLWRQGFQSSRSTARTPTPGTNRDKSDAIDAEAAAHKVLANESAVVPKNTTGVVEAIQQLKVARDSAVKSRAAALVQVGTFL
jgi:transposase